MEKIKKWQVDIGEGVFFNWTKLGEPMFIHAKDYESHFCDMIRARDWTPQQLRAMASYIEENKNCTKFREDI